MNKMNPRIENLPGMQLAGMRTRMSFAANQTRELWQNFMPRRSEITRMIGIELYSVEVFDNVDFFRKFDPSRMFEKWAAVKVEQGSDIPSGMETLLVPAGLYAVFPYKGKPSEAQQAYQFIYGSWLPQSGYEVDDRPHFAKMGEKYKGEHPESEEELWVPVRLK